MAADPAAVERLVGILKEMGYTVGPGHQSGKVDAAFVQACTPALRDLMRISGNSGEFTPAIGQQLANKMKEIASSSTNMGALEAYSKNQDYAPYAGVVLSSRAETRAALAAKGLSDQLLQPSNAGGVRKFILNAQGYINDINNVMPEVKAVLAAGPATSTTPTAGGRNPAPAPAASSTAAADEAAQRAEAERQAAAAAQRAQEEEARRLAAQRQQQEARVTKEIKDIQKDILGLPEAEQTGKLDATFNDKFRAHVKKTQEEAVAQGWTGPTDGVYTDDFHNWLKTSRGNADHALLYAAAEEFKATGMGFVALTSAPPSPPPPAAAPAPGAAGAPPAGATPPANVPPTPGDLSQASEIVETFLVEIGAAVNGRISEAKTKGGMMSGLLFEFKEIPVLATADGTFDQDSRRALQAAMKSMQKQLELTDDEIYNYTPEVGQKIVRALPRIERNLTDDQKRRLGGVDRVRGVIGALDALHAAGQVPAGEKLYEDKPFQLTPMGVSILEWLFKFVTGMFPGAKGLLDGMLKQLTGGFSYNDLMPADRQNPELTQIAAKYAHLPAEEQLKQHYIDAIKDAQANGKTPAELKDRLMQGVRLMTQLPIGDAASQQAFQAAVEKAFTEAEKHTDAEQAATAFATTFRQNWTPPVVNSPAGPAAQPAPGAGAPGSGAPGSGQSGSQASSNYFIDGGIANFQPQGGGTLDRMIDTFEKKTQVAEFQNGRQEPMAFTHTDGKVYVMGVTPGPSGGNMLTIRQITDDAKAALDKAIRDLESTTDNGARQKIVTDVRAAHPSLELLIGRYNQHFTLPELRDMLRPERALTFPQHETNTTTLWTNMRSYQRGQEEIERANETRAQRRYRAYGAEDGEPAPPSSSRRRGLPEAEVPGQLDRNLVAQNEHIGKLMDLRLAARSYPVVITDDYTGRGRMRVVFSDDYNGVQALINRYGDIRPALARGDEFFKTADITDDYKRFMADFNAYRSQNRQKYDRLDLASSFQEYKRDMEMSGVNLATRYPDMANVIFNNDPNIGGANYRQFNRGGKPDIVEFAWSLTGQVQAYDDSAFKRGGTPGQRQESGGGVRGWLRRTFGSSHDNEQGVEVQTQSSGGLNPRRPIPDAPNSPGHQQIEQRVRDQMPVANDLPAGADADQELQRTRPVDVMQEAGTGLTTRESRLGGNDIDPSTIPTEQQRVAPGAPGTTGR